MTIPAARAWLLGCGPVVVALAVSVAHAQTPARSSAPAGGAGAAAPSAAASAPTNAPAGPMKIGVIDMDKAFEGYKKASFLREQIKTAIVQKNGELTRLMEQMKTIVKELEGLDPSGNDYKTKQSEVTKLKAQYEAEREQAQGEFARKDAEALATIYKDIQDMSSRVARSKSLSFIVKVSNEPPSASDPNSVLAAMSQSVVFHDPSLDVTNVVVYNLNLQYDAQGGAIVPSVGGPAGTAAPSAPTTSAAPAPADRATIPAAAPAPSR